MRALHNKDERLSLKSNMIWNSVGSFVYLVCNWLITVLVVSLSTSYSASGALAVAMAVGNIAATIALFKVRPVQVASSDEDYLLCDYVGFRLATSFAALLFSAVYAVFTTSIDNLLPVNLYVVFKIIESFVDVYHAEFQRNDRMDLSGISQIIRGLLIVASFSAGLILFQNLTASIVLMVVSELVVIVLFDQRLIGGYSSSRPRFSWYRMRRLAVLCAPGFCSTLFLTFVVSNVRQSFGIQYGNEALGVYAAIATPTVIVQTLASFIYSPLYGPIGDAFRRGDGRWLISLIIKLIAAVFAILFFGCLVARVLGRPFFELLYGTGISSQVYLIYGALVSTAASAILYFLLDCLIVMNCQRGLLLCSVVPLVLCPLLTQTMMTEEPNTISVVISICYASGIVLALFCAVQCALRRNGDLSDCE